MHSQAKPPTKAERIRFDRLQEVGCVVTRVYFESYAPADLDHLLSGNVRRGHADTIPLRPWYHRGVAPYCKRRRRNLTREEAERLFGPSRALSPRQFHDRFGSNDELLAMTNQLLEAMERGRAA